MKTKTALLLVFGLLAMGQAIAARTISTLPWSESFNANNYADLIWITQGATQTFLPTGGFNGSGAVKFTAPNAEGYSGIGQVRFASTLRPTQLNVRFLIYHGRTWSQLSGGGKLMILNRDNNRDRPMLIYGEYPALNGAGAWDTLAPCNGTVCWFEGGDYWATGRETFRIGDGVTGRSHEWISIEFEANSNTGRLNLYIDTRDGYSKALSNTTSTGGPFFMMDILGGYMNRGNVRADPENYFIIDELAFSTSRIGPPAGFRGSLPPPLSAPVLLSVQ